MKIFVLSIAGCFTLLLLAWVWGRWNFQNQWTEAQRAVTISPNPKLWPDSPITEADLVSLPSPVRRWLLTAGVVGQKRIRKTYLVQTGWMRLKPGQEDWSKSQSEQWINLENPAFAWNVEMKLKGLSIFGIDRFVQGQGSMLMTLMGLIPVVRVGHHPKINQSALQRFLGEVIWTPTAALAPWIEWTALDEHSAKARMTIGETSGEALFYFAESGALERFVAMRFKDIQDDRPLEWHADVKAIETFHGLQIPSRIEATWILPEGPFTWFKFQIDEIKYE